MFNLNQVQINTQLYIIFLFKSVRFEILSDTDSKNLIVGRASVYLSTHAI